MVCSTPNSNDSDSHHKMFSKGRGHKLIRATMQCFFLIFSKFEMEQRIKLKSIAMSFLSENTSSRYFLNIIPS